MRPLIILSSVIAVLVCMGSADESSEPVLDNGVSDEDKKAIVDKMNELRRKVAKGQEARGASGSQPPARNMRQLSWDDGLAQAAQTLAERCKMSHDKTISGGGRTGYGQNVGVGYNNWDAVIQAWYGEVDQMKESQVSSFPGKGYGIGHYTQVVWATSYQVGCGFSRCASSSPSYVCNFWTPGNYRNSAVYKVGDAASACPEGTSQNDGLCA